MEFTAATIAKLLNGQVIGNPDTKVNTVAKIEEGHEGALSFLANPKYEHFIYSTRSSIVLVNNDFNPSSTVEATMIKVKDAYEAFASLLTLVEQSKPKKSGIHATAIIEPGAEIWENVYIGPYAYIGEGCHIGNNTRIYPHVYVGDRTRVGNDSVIFAGAKIYHECIIGNGCTIHAGSVIGSDGFGFAPQSDTEFMKIPQIGNVILEDHVEIGANAAIDRATMGSTLIRKGVKIDNLVQVGHNVEIGENTVMAGQTGIAGSTRIGRNCMFAGQVGIAGHLKIADNTKAGAQAGIAGDVKNENSVLLGSPAIDYLQYKRSYVVLKKLPEMMTRLESIKNEIDLLKNK
jgi:UDP-3-O-[3-hydroxymyristoyl] glucosamine N-acyltransferase